MGTLSIEREDCYAWSVDLAGDKVEVVIAKIKLGRKWVPVLGLCLGNRHL